MVVSRSAFRRQGRRRRARPLHRLSNLPPCPWRGVLLCDVQLTQVSLLPYRRHGQQPLPLVAHGVGVSRKRTRRPARPIRNVSVCPIQFSRDLFHTGRISHHCLSLYFPTTDFEPKKTENSHKQSKDDKT